MLQVGPPSDEKDDDEAKRHADDSFSNDMSSPGPSKSRTLSENSSESKLIIDHPSSGSGIRWEFLNDYKISKFLGILSSGKMEWKLFVQLVKARVKSVRLLKYRNIVLISYTSFLLVFCHLKKFLI